jgi:hypothetical protein
MVSFTAGALCALLFRAGSPAEAASGLLVRDTVEYRNAIYSGSLSRVFYMGKCIDSLETAFGLHCTGPDTCVYLRVAADERGTANGTYFTGLVLFSRGSGVDISDSLPLYNGHFSSPSVIGSQLYYWGFGGDEIYAVRFDFSAWRADSLRLDVRGSVITDSPLYFRRPVSDGKTIVYAITGGQVFHVHPALTMAAEMLTDTVMAPAGR